MGDGFLAIWLLAMGLVLYATGWKRHAVGDVSPVWLWSAAVFLILFHPWRIQLTGGIVMSGSSFGALIAAILLFCRPLPLHERLSAATALFAAGGLSWLSRCMYWLDPVMVLIAPKWDAPVIIAFIASLLAERFQLQAAIAVMAVTAAAFGEAAASSPDVIVLGGAYWWDQVIAALFMARLGWCIKLVLSQCWGKTSGWRTRLRGGNS